MFNKITGSKGQSPVTDSQVKPVEGVSKVKKYSEDQHDQPQTQQENSTKEKTEKVIDTMNGFFKESNTHLEYKYHDELKKYYVAIVDDQTNDVVKEIPSKKLLDIYAAMNDYLGLLMDKRA
ncbi:flagellar protein FlaG [Pullulanibacillus sp. KACC 23026]|uniref:flagellar protein FlaG n=1 Tax=Pullulanibacillus sp. KACC 23026 TaxID=3028315 RepID=UPI0023AEEEF2|nr:flagellar protein FlaG [Pullulanibacillus sp. KACC 23026]WEG11251.1 flagellar protein FlaG [Pullulanibacillus sp. KACC 23026]